MPDTPVLWRTQFQTNLGPSFGAALEPVVVALTNGNFVALWETEGIGSSTGVDIRGQIFNPLGEPIGGSFRANTSFTIDDEQNFDAAALPNGGFVLVYEDVAGPNLIDIRATEWTTTTDGGIGAATSFTVRSDPGLNRVGNPSVSATDGGGYVVAYDYDTPTQTEVRYRYVTPANAVGVEFSRVTDSFQSTIDTDVAVMSNGNYVVVYESDVLPTDAISFEIRNIDGTLVRSATQVFGTSGGANEFNPAVAATNFQGIPGFVVVWQDTDSNDTDVRFQIYSATGTTSASLGGFVDSLGISDNHQQPEVFALPDGFVVMYRDEDADALRFQRFDTTGNERGATVTVDTGNINGNITGVQSEDGRLIFTFQDGLDVFVEIYDPRDAENDPGIGPDRVSVGTVGNDVIDEDFNINRIYAWTGNDLVRVTTSIAADLFDGGAGNDTIDWSAVNESGTLTFDLTAGLASDSLGNSEVMENFENLIGTDQDDSISGTNGANALSGGAGNDTLIGLLGDDTLNGNLGDDVFAVQADFSTKQISGGAGVDVLDLSTSTENWDVSESVATSTNLFLTTTLNLSSIETVIGSLGNDTIRETAGFNDMRGGDGDDLIISDMDNSDTEDGGAGDDTLDASGRSSFAADVSFDMLSGVFNGTTATNFEAFISGVGDDSIQGTNGANDIRGGAGNDTIDARAGNDTVDGGLGNDVISGGPGTNTVTGGSGSDTITSGGNGSYSGDSGNDLIRAGLTSTGETLDGGSGIDTLDTTTFTGGYLVNLGTGATNFSSEYFINFENVTTGSGDDTIFGTDFINVISSGVGNDEVSALDGDDLVNGGDGDDTLNGGLGGDTLNGGAGTDSLQGGGGNDSLMGDAAIDTLRGGDGDDTLNGGGDADRVFGDAGDDLMILGLGDGSDNFDGGTGSDTVDFRAIGLAVSADFNSATWRFDVGFFSQDLISVENVFFGAGNDSLDGSIENNLVDGGAGNDRLRSFGGDDTVLGGAGDDTVNGGTGNDDLNGGTGNDTMYGQDGDDTISGGDGNDLIIGNDGADTMLGGVGNDDLQGREGDDLLITGVGDDMAFGGDGNDNVLGDSGNDTLQGNDGNDTIRGDAGDDQLFGQIGADEISGGAGLDEVLGGDGNDLLFGDADNDTLFGGSGADTLSGGDGADLLRGGAQNDQLAGDAGNDTLFGEDGFDALIGGAGNDDLFGGNAGDTLTGGAGVDRLNGGAGFDDFDFNAASDSSAGASDLIQGFDNAGTANGEMIDLSDIDADVLVFGDQAFTFLGAVPLATGLAAGPGSLWVETAGTQTILRGNTNNDATIELEIRINDGVTLANTYTVDDFIL